MKLAIAILGVLMMAVGCKGQVSEAKYQATEWRAIAQHAHLLEQSGHMGKTLGSFHWAMFLGQYGWHPGYCEEAKSNCTFGAYSFYQPAFEQAKRSWWIHGYILEGDNLLMTDDDNVKFDDSMVGYTVGSMSMMWKEHGELKAITFSGAKVIKVISAHEAVLDKMALHHAEMWGLGILPPDWEDMCACTF